MGQRKVERVRLILSGTTAVGGRDGALRRPRRVQRRNMRCDSFALHAFRPLDAGGDGAARRPYLSLALMNVSVAPRLF
jgi:hypothetical protein